MLPLQTQTINGKTQTRTMLKGKTLLLKIQDDADVARGVAILRGEASAEGIDTIQLFVFPRFVRKIN